LDTFDTWKQVTDELAQMSDEQIKQSVAKLCEGFVPQPDAPLGAQDAVRNKNYAGTLAFVRNSLESLIEKFNRCLRFVSERQRNIAKAVCDTVCLYICMYFNTNL
jgi:hypothetical protein